MEEIDKFFQESHYSMVRVLARVTGLWPCDSSRKRWAIYIAYILILGSGIFFEMLGMVQVRSDLFTLVDCVPLFLVAISSVIQAAGIAYTLPEAKILLIKIKEYWGDLKSKDEKQILYKYAVYGQKMGYIYTFSLLSHDAAFLCVPLLNKFIFGDDYTETEANNSYPPALPYRANYMVDPHTYFIPIYLHMALCDMWYIVLTTTVNLLYITLVQHCCGLFTILRYRLENMSELQDDRNNNLTMASTQEESYAYVAYTIRQHTEALQFTSFLETMYGIPLLSYAVCNIVALGVVGFMILYTNDRNRLMRYCLHLSADVIITFFMHWQGQRIIDYSGKIYNAAYNLQWYNTPIETRKLLIIIMMRSRKPAEITAGKFMVMSYVNFNAVMRLSASYFTLLRSFQ